MVLADDHASLLKRWTLSEEQQLPLLALLVMWPRWLARLKAPDAVRVTVMTVPLPLRVMVVVESGLGREQTNPLRQRSRLMTMLVPPSLMPSWGRSWTASVCE